MMMAMMTAPGLPVYVRSRDINAAGIAKNWPTLTRLIEEENFPRGVMLSPNIRAWRLDEIEAWLETRPVERKPVPTRWGRSPHSNDLNKRKAPALTGAFVLSIGVWQRRIGDQQDDDIARDV